MYLINGISDSGKKARFEVKLHEYCEFQISCSPVSSYLAERWWIAISQIGIYAWDEKSKYYPFLVPIHNIIPVLYATHDYLEQSKEWIDQRMNGRKWFFIDSETNEGFDLLIEEIKNH